MISDVFKRDQYKNKTPWNCNGSICCNMPKDKTSKVNKQNQQPGPEQNSFWAFGAHRSKVNFNKVLTMLTDGKYW